MKLLLDFLKDLPKNIEIPTLVIQGLKDDIVPVTSAEYIFDNVKSKKKGLIYVKKANHDLFNSSDQDIINERILKFLKYTKIQNEKETI